MNKKSKATIITNIICCVAILFMSIGYSSFSRNLSADEILASVRIATDIRVNGVEVLNEGTTGEATGQDYNHNSIEGIIKLPTPTSEVTYNVDILNISKTEYEITSVSGLPDYLDYEIMNYNLGDKLCVDEKCTMGMEKQIQVKIKYKKGATMPSSSEHNFQLFFDFQPYEIRKIYIKEVKSKILNNGGEEIQVPTYDDTTANFEVRLPNATSTVEYDIIILNNLKEIKKLQSIETLPNSNSAIDYEITGLSIGDIFAPADEKVAHIKIYAKPGASEAELANPQLSIKFNFETEEWIPLEIEFLSAESGSLNVDSEIPFQIKVTNKNDVPANYEITIDDANFIIEDDSTNRKPQYQVGANSSLTNTVSISIRNDVTYEKKQKKLMLMLKVTYPTKKDRTVRELTLDLPSVFQTAVLTSRDITTPPSSYSDAETTEGYLMRTNEFDNLDSIYYFRGVINDNYVYFADHMWRITRVNYDGNIRLVLNENVSSTDNVPVKVKFSNNYVKGTEALDSLEEGINVLDYRNSNLKQVVDNWYDTNIADTEFAKHVVDSKFCAELNYEDPIETEYGHSVYYFTSYIRVGKDFSNYHPKFACQTDSIITSKVGLLRGEEIFAAGGFWGKENKNYFLYNPDLPSTEPQTSWTISAAYYSIYEQQAGVITYNQPIVEGSGGSIFDWVQGGNLAEEYGYRPVITINGNVKIHGTGTKDDPYVIAE